MKHLASDSDTEHVMFDATIGRAHQHGAELEKNGADQAIGRSRGGLTTKIHALADALGNPFRFILTPGQVHDVRAAPDLLDGVACGALIGDKGYDADALIERLR